MSSKIDVFPLWGDYIKLLSDEQYKPNPADFIIFFGIPILMMGAYLFLTYFTSYDIPVDQIYIAFQVLTGFVFSAFVIFLSLQSIISQTVNERQKTNFTRTAKEVAVISLIVFFCGVILIFLSVMNDVVEANSQESLASIIIKSATVLLAVFSLLNLLMLIKKLFRLLDMAL